MRLCAVACATAVLLAVADDAFRAWHDVKGRAITAKLVTCDGSTVTLQRQDGRQSTMALAQLAPADRMLATALVTRSTSAARIALTGANGAQVALAMPAPATVPCGIMIESCAPAAAEVPLGQQVTLAIRYQFTAPTRVRLVKDAAMPNVDVAGIDVVCSQGMGTARLGWMTAKKPMTQQVIALELRDAMTTRRIFFHTELFWKRASEISATPAQPAFIRCPVPDKPTWALCTVTVDDAGQHVPGTLTFSFDDVMKVKGTAVLSSARSHTSMEIGDIPPLALAYLLALDLQAATERNAADSSADAAPAPPAASLPASFSLRPEYKRLGLDVGDQGRRGSCLIFGVINPLEFHLARRGNKVKLSERFTSWAANTVRGKTGGSEGYTPADVLNSIKMYGYTTEHMFGAEYRDKGNVGRPDKDALADAATRRNVQVAFFGLSSLTAADLQAMCAAITSSNPVTLCLQWPQAIKFGNRKLIRPWKKADGGHAIIAVGYELDKDKPGGGMFEVRNSWGDNWGSDGYAYLSFELLQQNHQCAFMIAPE